MVTYEEWVARFPQFLTVPEPRFNLFLGDSQLLMGKTESRWGTAYNVAQAHLIAHLTIAANRATAGESGALVPIRSKEVDDVVVEYALSRDQQNTFDDYNSTGYGQTYLKYRNNYFSGPRVVG